MPLQRKKTSLLEVLSYTPPRLYTGKEWYIGFYAFDPEFNKMRRKKIKINHIVKIGERRTYARDLILRLSKKLREGWNPWVDKESPEMYLKLEEAVQRFFNLQMKYLKDNIIREATYVEYKSKIRNLLKYNEKRKVRITYIYQLDRLYLQEFLDYIYIDRGNTAKTHDNYLRVLSVFCKFLVKSGMQKTNAVDGLEVIGKRHYVKNRTVIADKDLLLLRDYLLKKNKHFLMACYLEYYCMIRPKEMAMLRIRDISLKNQTIYISNEISKNRKDAVVTMNNKLVRLMIDLNIFSYPDDYYLFSFDFNPGKEGRSEKKFRDFWLNHVMKDLKFPIEYKFYSLKDSGVTQMLKSHIDSLSVRDQARHSSISITDIYTPHDIQDANPVLKNFDSDF